MAPGDCVGSCHPGNVTGRAAAGPGDQGEDREGDRVDSWGTVVDRWEIQEDRVVDRVAKWVAGVRWATARRLDTTPGSATTAGRSSRRSARSFRRQSFGQRLTSSAGLR